MSKSVTKSDLSKEIARLTKFSYEEVDYIMSTFVDVVRDHLVNGREVTIKEVVRFYPATVGPFRSNLKPNFFIKAHTHMRAKVSPKVNDYLKRHSTVKEL